MTLNTSQQKTGDKTGYHIEHILSRNITNIKFFSNEEEFELSTQYSRWTFIA